jgi:hypothetical protein
MAKLPFPFSWSALLIAPLVTSIPAGILLAAESIHPVVAFGLGALVGYIFTFAVEGGLLLPALWLVSRVVGIKPWLPPVIGGLLAAPIFLAWDYTNWSSSGVDSGPPAMTYPQWVAKSWFTPEPLVVISLGVVTASVYYFLVARSPNKPPHATPALGPG